MVLAISPKSSPEETQLVLNILGNVGGKIQCEIVDISGGGAPSQGGFGNINRSDGAGGWLSSFLFSFGGDDISQIDPTKSLAISSSGPLTLQSNDILSISRQASYVHTSDINANHISLVTGNDRFAGANGDELRFNGVAFPTVGIPLVDLLYEMPSTSGNDGDILQRVGALGKAEWVAPTGMGDIIGRELFDAALIDSQDIPWVGAGGGFGDLYLATVVPASNTDPINFMSALVTQLGGGGGINLGIYDSAGVRLAYGDITAPVLGVNTIPMTNGGGLQLIAGVQYFFAVYSNQNGARICGSSGLSGVPAGLNLGFRVPNSGSQPGQDEGMPPDVSAFFGTQTTERYWAAARN